MRSALDRDDGVELGSVERVVAMRSFPGAGDLAASELAVLASIARPRRIPAEGVLAREGHVLSAVSVLLEGEVVTRRGQEVERVGPGGSIGLLPALARDPRGLEGKAATPALVLDITIEDLEDVFEEVPRVLVRVMAHVAREALSRGARRAPAPGDEAALRVPSGRPLDLVERILVLRRCPALAGASIDAVAALANVAREVRAGPGHALFRSGDAATSMLVVAAGELEISGPAAPSLRVAPGGLAGELEMLASEPRRATATAASAVTALAIDRDALLDAWEDHTDLGCELLRDVSALAVSSGGTP